MTKSELVEAKVILKNQSLDGQSLSACFLPGKGMNFISYKKGSIEAIDQSTMPLFEERYAGLGAMIGPHFHHRSQNRIPRVPNPSLFPHLAALKAKGTNEPFSHGIGRYAPWSIESVTENSIKATLKGDNQWKGISLKQLEGQNFSMRYEANLLPEGLEIRLSVVSDEESVVGLHTYYALSDGKGRVIANVKDQYNDQGTIKQIPPDWNYKGHTLKFDLDKVVDFGFSPFPNAYPGSILMETASHKIQVQYWSDNEDNSWQLWHPSEVSFVCLEPLSSKNPRKPGRVASDLKILISIL